MRPLLTAAAFLAVLPFTAFAADLPSRKDPPVYVPPPVFTWTGFYIGGNAGYSWGQSSVSEIPTGAYLAAGIAPGDLASIANVGTVTPRRGNFTGGGQAGFNYQVGTLVVGIEGSLGYLNTKTSVSNSAVFSFPGTGLSSTTAGMGSLFGTVLGRAGVAFEHVLLYATGGLAVANTSLSQTLFFPPLAATALGSISTTRVGWAAGAGVEWAFTNNWTVKVEYLHVDLGKASVGFAAPAFPTFTNTTSAHFSDDLVRVGINYKFDWFAPSSPVVAKY